MSFEEHSHWSNTGRIGDLMHEVIFIQSFNILFRVDDVYLQKVNVINMSYGEHTGRIGDLMHEVRYNPICWFVIIF